MLKLSRFKKVFFFLFLFFNLQVLTTSAAGDCRSFFGSSCVSSVAECNSNQYYDSMSTCPSELPICCRLNEESPSPTPTPTPDNTECLENGGGCYLLSTACANGELSYNCGSNQHCCQENVANLCTQNGGSCFPTSTACYGGVENELSYSCNSSSQHCCQQSSSTCESKGGSCVMSSSECPTGTENALSYYCEDENQRCCIKSDSPSGSGAWQDGLTKANQAANLPDADFKKILNKFLTYLLSLFTLLGVIFFILTGLRYIFGGATGTVEKSKLGIQSLVLGIVVGLSGYIIIRFVNFILGG